MGDYGDITWAAIANGSAVWIIQAIGEVAKYLGFKGTALRVSLVVLGVVITAFANHYAGGDWPIGVVKGLVWTAIALGLYSRIKGGERSQ